MGWLHRHHEVLGRLSPEVARFVWQALLLLEQENVFDAPGVISGVLRRMRTADSDAIRGAAIPTERLLKAAFAPRAKHRAGA
jgi:hypothetical protein